MATTPTPQVNGSSKKPISTMGSRQASSRLRVISTEALRNRVLDSALQSELIDATQHRAESVVVLALEAIGHCRDKTPFVSAIIQCAQDSRLDVAKAAYGAMSLANDITPFSQTLDNGTKSPTLDIVHAAMERIKFHALVTHALPVDLHSTLTDATQHRAESVVVLALEAIGHCRDKRPFVSAIIQCAQDSRLDVAKAAYGAMSLANDITPFSQTLDNGTKSPTLDIVHAAMERIKFHALVTRALPVDLHSTLTDAIRHPDESVVVAALEAIAECRDKTPFIAALTSLKDDTLRPKLAEVARDVLKGMGDLPVPTPQSHPKVEVLRGIRLDFNTEANGGDSGKHKIEAVAAMKNVFAKATNGEESVEALVFYDPQGRLAEGKSIQVRIKENDIDAILAAVLQQTAPECDLSRRTDGTYEVTLSEGPKF